MTRVTPHGKTSWRGILGHDSDNHVTHGKTLWRGILDPWISGNLEEKKEEGGWTSGSIFHMSSEDM